MRRVFCDVVSSFLVLKFLCCENTVGELTPTVDLMNGYGYLRFLMHLVSPHVTCHMPAGIALIVWKNLLCIEG